MTSGRNIPTSTLEEWTRNFRNNKDLPFSTNTAAVSLEQLENYIADIKRKYSPAPNGLKIYFVRFPLSNATAQEKVENAGKSLSQPSVVIVPIKNYNSSTGSGDDHVLENPGDLYVLSFSDPESTDPNDSTALCPPKCG
jgi:hypothetical protein